MGYTRDWTKEELIEIILNCKGENIGGSCKNGCLTYMELRQHKLMKFKKEELRQMAQMLLNKE